MTHRQLERLHATQRARARHVRVQHARHSRAVYREMYKKRRRVHLSRPLEQLPAPIDHHQITRRDLAPRQPVRRAQKRILSPRRRARQVIAHALVESKLIAQLIARRELDARAPDVGVVPFDRRREVDVPPGVAPRRRVAVADARVRAPRRVVRHLARAPVPRARRASRRDVVASSARDRPITADCLRIRVIRDRRRDASYIARRVGGDTSRRRAARAEARRHARRRRRRVRGRGARAIARARFERARDARDARCARKMATAAATRRVILRARGRRAATDGANGARDRGTNACDERSRRWR